MNIKYLKFFRNRCKIIKKNDMFFVRDHDNGLSPAFCTPRNAILFMFGYYLLPTVFYSWQRKRKERYFNKINQQSNKSILHWLKTHSRDS